MRRNEVVLHVSQRNGAPSVAKRWCSIYWKNFNIVVFQLKKAEFLQHITIKVSTYYNLIEEKASKLSYEVCRTH
jgi:hypothetical protein